MDCPSTAILTAKSCRAGRVTGSTSIFPVSTILEPGMWIVKDGKPNAGRISLGNVHLARCSFTGSDQFSECCIIDKFNISIFQRLGPVSIDVPSCYRGLGD